MKTLGISVPKSHQGFNTWVNVTRRDSLFLTDSTGRHYRMFWIYLQVCKPG